MKSYSICLSVTDLCSILSSRVICVAAYVRIHFLVKAEHIPVCVYTPHFFMHSSTDGHLEWFHLLAIVIHAVMNMDVQIAFHDPTFSSFGYILKSGMPSGSVFKFLRKKIIVLHSSCNILQFHHHCTRVSISPYPCQPLLLSGFFASSHPKWYEVISHCGFPFHVPDD